MVDWKSPQELQRDYQIFDKLLHALLGLYIWEILTTLDFEWEFISGKKKLRWPMIFYFLDRYLQLFALIGAIIGLDTTKELRCQPLYRFIFFAGFSSVVLSSVNLAIRTIALWANNLYVIAAIALTTCGQFTLLILVLTSVRGIWTGMSCSVKGGENHISAFFIYTMCLNAAVLLFTTVKLVKMNENTNGKHLLGQSKLTHVIFADGLIFFIVALLADVVVVVFVNLNLNPIMNVMFQVPSSVISTIVACRAVRRLMNFSHGSGPIMLWNKGNSSSDNRKTSSRSVRGIQSVIQSKPGVHVQMETFTHHEDGFESKEASESITEGDIESRHKGAI